jgi:LemA protein
MVGWILLGLLVLLLAWLVVVYNRLVALRQTTGQAWSDVDVQLKQRHDLVPNLVETVKGYAAHERGTLDAVVQARNAAALGGGGPRTPEQAAAAEGALGAAIGRLFALAEAYPDLKANAIFQALQAELSDLENRIAAARRFFNNAVAEYNAAIQQVPAVFFAGALGFTPRGFFEPEAAERAAIAAPPRVAF